MHGLRSESEGPKRDPRAVLPAQHLCRIHGAGPVVS
jgi:hypothetical protein